MTVAPTDPFVITDEDMVSTIAAMEADLAAIGIPADNIPASFYEQTPPPAVTSPPVQIPAADAPAIFTGTGLYPTWNDLATYTAQQIESKTAQIQGIAAPTNDSVNQSVLAASGETIKSLSGMINNAVDITVLYTTELSNRITDVENLLAAIEAQHTATEAGLKTEVDTIVHNAIPTLHNEILLVQAQAQHLITAERTALQQWAVETILNPLHTEINAVHATLGADITRVQSSIPDIVRSIVPTLGLASAAGLAGVASRVATLEAEDANCVKPMCATMGPNTGLGKLLKALSLLADAALIAELFGKTAPELEHDLEAIIGKFANLVLAFEGFFAPGGETLGSLVKPLLSAAV